ncbi:MAG TPA: tRNA preQ1(34) S-adenosylmethionine ribosyltransferase-isomerase QueA [Candidatus Dormibacteraeota bacterium]|nr:tRNA preQ1(34) S-adenosylmethionine ribosyltransferase-isomerase QueA [Candidatus Dormibacteraeota bacterium]
MAQSATGKVGHLNLSEFDYDLPQERIAQWPLEERDASRMLLLDRRSGAWEDRQFREFPDILRGDELIVINNARVLPARLWGHRKGAHAQPVGNNSPIRKEYLSAVVEVLLLRACGGDEWEALVRPGRKIPVGETIIFGDGELRAEVVGRAGYGLRRLKFACSGNALEAIERLGHIPLPPYIKRDDSAIDRERYQTVFARRGAAVAAPTAGLHFTSEILSRVRKRGVEVAEITLDVGLGTFEPVRTERLEDHHIHSESYEISVGTAQAVARARAGCRPVLAVGTTVVRALEDAAQKFVATRAGAQSRGDAHQNAVVAAGRAEADIFLFPGKPFRVVDQLLTNFHLPRSSLLALVAGFAGRENVLRAYRHAVEAEYRFYSYGDCMWIR